MSEVYFGDSDNWHNLWDSLRKPAEIPCTCGTRITLGKDDNPVFHSSWCKVKEDFNTNAKFDAKLNDKLKINK